LKFKYNPFINYNATFVLETLPDMTTDFSTSKKALPVKLSHMSNKIK